MHSQIAFHFALDNVKPMTVRDSSDNMNLIPGATVPM